MEKKKRERVPLTAAEEAECNATWDKYAADARADMASGEMAVEQAVMLGLTIDTTAEHAKTEYLKKAMLELAVEIVDFLDSEMNNKELPPDIRAKQHAHAEEAKAGYLERIAELEKSSPEAVEAAKKAQEAKDAEAAHVHAEAGGIFANVSLADILGAPQAPNLPNY